MFDDTYYDYYPYDGQTRTVYSSSLLDNLMNGATPQRLAIVGKGLFRNLSDSIMNGAGRYAVLGYLTTHIKSLSDNIMVGASRNVSLTRLATYYRTLSDNITNGASRLVVLTSFWERLIRPIIKAIKSIKPRINKGK
jgi:hypothetical protein